MNCKLCTLADQIKGGVLGLVNIALANLLLKVLSFRIPFSKSGLPSKWNLMSLLIEAPARAVVVGSTLPEGSVSCYFFFDTRQPLLVPYPDLNNLMLGT